MGHSPSNDLKWPKNDIKKHCGLYLKDTSEGYGYYGPPSHHKLEDEVVAQENLQIFGSDSESGAG